MKVHLLAFILLTRDKPFTIHHRNAQTLAIEIYKAINDISPVIMKVIFVLTNY